ncbi:MAG: BlaI/MecI/CopY family transcriptional regulator [Lachnospiraceae bacterium]|jgi:BlaI family penicillinase repressor|nr:BlaI/MecI/CopY family transcriptional regulator [uncultured Acetatifactor sp.]MCI9220977.1 BlaI/MecI/CopY family transcriptional regulator [Lachnospiraceae bacterium]
MSELRMGTAEARFADMIWDNEPISSGDLAKLAGREFEWKKTTSFTVLKRLCQRGLFQNQNGTVTSLVSRKEFYARHSQQYVEDAFGGSLPAFLAAFGTRKKLSEQEIEEIQGIIDSMRGVGLCWSRFS